MTTVNVYLTKNQREFLTDLYIETLSKMDGFANLIDDAMMELMHMNNSDFYAECKEFMPGCMLELRNQEIR